MALMKPLWIAVLSLFLISCSADIDDYKETSPTFALFDYFNGHTKAWGMVQDYTSKQTRRFEVDIVGKVSGDTLVLDESFIYDDGETSTRQWTITRTSDSDYIGSADDIIGQAIGKEVGNAFQWKYDFELAVDGDLIQVHFDDWLFRQDERHLFNTTSIEKFGFEVGKVTLFFSKDD